MIDERYSYLAGKQTPGGAPLHFMRCECGMLVLTKPELHGQYTTCGNCARNAEGRVPLARHARPRSESRALLGLAAVLVLGIAWLATNAAGKRDEREAAIDSEWRPS
jgi:hypothetical protein